MVTLVLRGLPRYGLDIETDTSAGGLDPGRAGVVAVAVSGERRDHVLRGPERDVLIALDRVLARLRPGILVTWNGAGFDLPFLDDRARHHGVRLGLRLVADASIVRHREPLPGHDGAYRASWHRHRHLDAYLAYRTLLEGSELSCALKATARRAGMAPVEVDVARLHLLPAAAVERYVASDARTARLLAERRWTEVEAFIDGPPGAELRARSARRAAG